MSGCVYIDDVDQPLQANPGETITIYINAQVEGNTIEQGYPKGGVKIPNDWTVISCTYTGSYSGTMTEDPVIAEDMELNWPSGLDYYWWGGKGPTTTSNSGSVVNTTLIVQMGQSGSYLIDYRVGDNLDGWCDEELDVPIEITAITSSAPPSPVNDTYCTWTKFNVSVDQTVNVTWYLNGTPQTPANESVTEANYTFHAEYIGEHNVSAVAENANGMYMQMWIWNVTAAPQTYNCTCGDICVNQTGWWRDGGVLNESNAPIQAAVDAAEEGETICVAAGSYTENVNIGTSNLTLAGAGADVVNVRDSTSDHVFDVTADYVNISGFSVTGATSGGKAGIYLYGADYCNISDNNASGNYYGIYLYSSSNNTLANNNANSNNDYGIKLCRSNDNALMSNTASGNEVGIALVDSSNNNTLTSNTASDNSNWDIYIDNSPSNTFADNTLNGTTVSFTHSGDVSLRGVGHGFLIKAKTS